MTDQGFMVSDQEGGMLSGTHKKI